LFLLILTNYSKQVLFHDFTIKKKKEEQRLTWHEDIEDSVEDAMRVEEK